MILANNLSCEQNEIQFGVYHKSATAPTSPTPVEGQYYYNTADKLVYRHNGTGWVVSNITLSGTSPVNVSQTDTAATVSIDSATAGGLGVIKLTGDFGGTAGSPTVATVGGASAADIASAASLRHSQNTDTGTSSASFQLNSSASGLKLKDVSGELQLRNAADGDYVSLRVKNLTVEGDTVNEIKSTEVLIGDSAIELNAGILLGANNSNGGSVIRRLGADVVGAGTISATGLVVTGLGTAFLTSLAVGDVLVFGAQRRRVKTVASDLSLTLWENEAFSPLPSNSAYSIARQANAELFFDNSNGVFKVIDGAVTAQQTFAIARKISFSVGDGIAKNFVLTHNLNTRALSVDVSQSASPYAQVMPDNEKTTLNTITIKFSKIPTSGQYIVTLVG